MKKDEMIVYPPEAGPQAGYQRVTVPRVEEEQLPTSNGPLRFGWVMMLLAGLFWGGMVWMYGSGTELMGPIRVFDVAPDYCLPVLYALGGLSVFAAILALVRGAFLRMLFLLIAGPVMVALCLASGTLLRVQFGRLTVPGMPAAAAEKVQEISLTNRDGWEMKAVPVSILDDRLILKVDGQSKEVRFSSLNEASQRKVKEFFAGRKP